LAREGKGEVNAIVDKKQALRLAAALVIRLLPFVL
jgi:hypothetical protein